MTFPFPMRGWKSAARADQTIDQLVPVPHEGLEGRLLDRPESLLHGSRSP